MVEDGRLKTIYGQIMAAEDSVDGLRRGGTPYHLMMQELKTVGEYLTSARIELDKYLTGNTGNISASTAAHCLDSDQ